MGALDADLLIHVSKLYLYYLKYYDKLKIFFTYICMPLNYKSFIFAPQLQNKLNELEQKRGIESTHVPSLTTTICVFSSSRNVMIFDRISPEGGNLANAFRANQRSGILNFMTFARMPDWPLY